MQKIQKNSYKRFVRRDSYKDLQKVTLIKSLIEIKKTINEHFNKTVNFSNICVAELSFENEIQSENRFIANFIFESNETIIERSSFITKHQLLRTIKNKTILYLCCIHPILNRIKYNTTKRKIAELFSNSSFYPIYKEFREKLSWSIQTHNYFCNDIKLRIKTIILLWALGKLNVPKDLIFIICKNITLEYFTL
jgi:hypothetical protein